MSIKININDYLKKLLCTRILGHICIQTDFKNGRKTMLQALVMAAAGINHLITHLGHFQNEDGIIIIILK